MTHAENVLRGSSPTAKLRAAKLCKYGHEFSWAPSGKHRVCLDCARQRNRSAYHANREERRARMRAALRRKKEGLSRA